VDKRRIELQLRAIRVTLRVEQPRHSTATMDDVRMRARELLDGLEEAVRPFPDLADELAAARREIDAKGS
jgi:hypothetical protein